MILFLSKQLVMYKSNVNQTRYSKNMEAIKLHLVLFLFLFVFVQKVLFCFCFCPESLTFWSNDLGFTCNKLRVIEKLKWQASFFYNNFLDYMFSILLTRTPNIVLIKCYLLSNLKIHVLFLIFKIKSLKFKIVPLWMR